MDQAVELRWKMGMISLPRHKEFSNPLRYRWWTN